MLAETNLSISGDITFKLFIDRSLKFTKTISNDTAFKMPAGYKSKKVELQVSGYIPVRSVEVATSMGELANDRDT